MKRGALSDIKVLDLTHYVAGPFCTKLLADYGANVIKVERPEKANEAGPCNPVPGGSGLSIFLNTNKKSITLNLKTQKGVKIFKDLAKQADVIVENFKPGVMASLDLDYHNLESVNPKLVVTSISNFGQTGPYKDYKATELVSVAMGGLLTCLGERDREPVKPVGSQAQFHAGLIGAVATLSALFGAKMTGMGQHVDVSIMEAEMSMVQLHIMTYPYSGGLDHRTGSQSGYYPWAVYACKDGYISVGVHQVLWKRAGPWIGRPELADDPRLSVPAERLKHFEELDSIFLPWFLERTKSEIVSSGQANRIPVTGVNTPEDMLRDPQFQAREFFVDIDHPETGRFTCPGAPFKMSETPWQIRRPAPLLGECNEEIYCGQLGYSKEDLAELSEQGVI